MSRPLPMLTALRRRKKILPTAFSGGGVSAYAVNSFDPDTVADFAGVNNSGTEYYRVGGTETTFASMFTHARSSNATMVDSDGNLKWAPHNLIPVSNDFSSADWTKSAAGSGSAPTVSVNNATDPDGGSTADTVTFTCGGTTSGDRSRLIETVLGIQDSAEYTGEIWLRVASGTLNVLLLNLATGTGASSATESITITTTWTKFSATGTNGTGATSVSLEVRATGDLVGASAVEVECFGAHLYRSDLGGMVNNPDRGDSYVSTTSAARYLPRRNHYRYNGSSYVKKGLLLESAAATNLLVESRPQSASQWINGSNASTSSGTSILGLTTSTITSTTTTGFVADQVSGNATTQWCAWIIAKANSLSSVAIRVGNGGNYVESTFNLSTGAAGTPTTGGTGTNAASGMSEIGSGIYLCYVTGYAIGDGSTISFNIYPGTNGTGIGSVDVPHAQFESGAVPTSMIPTSGATATRAAETLTIAGANMAYSATAMSLQMQGEMTYADTGSTTAVTFYRALSGASYIRTTLRTDGAAVGSVYALQINSPTAAAQTLVDAYSPGVSVPFNIAVRHLADAINAAADGSAGVVSSVASSLPDLSGTSCSIGLDLSGTIALFRQDDADWTDTGIEEATS